MKAKTWRRDCIRCNKGFITVIEGMEYCNTSCACMHDYEKRFHIKKDFGKGSCLTCGMGLSGAKKYCDMVCRRGNESTDIRETRNKKANASEKKPRKSGISSAELNRRVEYKRLYEDFYIRRQINGKTRDLI